MITCTNQSCHMDLNGKQTEIAHLRELNEGEMFHIAEDDLAVIWLYNGTGALSIDMWGGIYMLGNDFLCLSGIHDMDLAQVSEGTRVFLLMIRKTALDLAITKAFSNRITIQAAREILQSQEKDAFLFHWPNSAKLISSMEILIADFSSTYDLQDLVILDLIRLLERILTIKEKDFAPVHSATHSNAVMYVVKYIRENFATASLNDVAASLHYSPAYLSQLLKERLGMNFYQLLDFRRSVVGRKLLLESREPMDAIALKLGFQSYAGFYKFWKKQQGMSPKEYRKKFSQENVKIDRDIHRIR